MKKVLSVLVALLLFGSINAQTYLLNESFNNGIPSTWTMFNDNNSPYYTQFSNAWMSGTSLVGLNCAVSTSYFTPAATADRWLVTPTLSITDSNTYLYFMSESYSSQYPEKLLVKASTGGAVKDSFTTTLQTIEQVPGTWTEYYIKLDQFIGKNVNLAFQLNTNDGFVILLDEVRVYVPLQTQVSLVSLTTPRINAINTNMNVEATVKNTGYKPLTSFQATYTVNGTTSAAMNVSGLNVAMGGTYTFTHEVPFNTATPGNYTFSVNVTSPNGTTATMLNPDSVTSTTMVYNPAETTSRSTLLEEFSTANCGYCPPAASRIKSVVDNLSNIIWIVHHAGYYTDDITCDASSDATFFYNDGGSTYAPAMMLNRTQYDATNPGPVAGVGAAADITSSIATAQSDPCFANIAFNNVAFDASSRAVTGTVTGNFTSATVPAANPVITVYVVEDSILLSQVDYSTGSSRTISNYPEMNAVHSCLTASMGDALTIGANNAFSYTINYTLPTTFKANRCRLVALVSNYDASNANNCVVFNAASTNRLGSSVSIDEVSNIDMQVYPNPANDRVNIFANENINTIRVVNALGQVVYNNSNVNGEAFSLNTNEYASGMYIITVTTDKGVSTQRLSVRH